MPGYKRESLREEGTVCLALSIERPVLPDPNTNRGTLLTVAKQGIETTNSLDRGSVKFLLNSGTASFIECFRFPSPWERRNIHDLKTSANQTSDTDILDLIGTGSENDSSYSAAFEDEPFDWSVFDDENFLRFFSSPFVDGQMSSDNLITVSTGPMLQNLELGSGLPMALPGDWEAPSIHSAAIAQALLDKASSLPISAEETAEISRHLNFLFKPSRIDELCSLYFEFWHPHCPIIHRPSFRIETEPIPLIVSMTLMGAMYSHDEKIVSTAKLLLDLAELYVYSMDDFREDFEIWQMMRLSSTSQHEQSVGLSNQALQHVQSAHLMVCAQFWAGNTVAKKRVVETRFGVVIKVTTSPTAR